MVIIPQILINFLAGYFLRGNPKNKFKDWALIIFPVLSIVVEVAMFFVFVWIRTGIIDPAAISVHLSAIVPILIQFVLSIIIQLLFNYFILDKLNRNPDKNLT